MYFEPDQKLPSIHSTKNQIKVAIPKKKNKVPSIDFGTSNSHIDISHINLEGSLIISFCYSPPPPPLRPKKKKGEGKKKRKIRIKRKKRRESRERKEAKINSRRKNKKKVKRERKRRRNIWEYLRIQFFN